MEEQCKILKVCPIMEQQNPEIVSIYRSLNSLDIEGAFEKLSNLSEKDKKAIENFDKGGSLLYVAISVYKDGSEKAGELYDFIEHIIEDFPLLLKKSRSDTQYAGQTPLHIAIVQGNIDIVKLILKRGKARLKTKFTEEVLHIPAKGTKFKNTVMMGQLPLSVAALSLNKEIVRILMNYRANIGKQNKHGDTVLHSLVKYAAIYPDKLNKIMKMLNTLNKEYIANNYKSRFSQTPCKRKEFKYDEGNIGLWFMTNNEYYTPLQLAAKLGIAELVGFILGLKDVYFFVSEMDGLFDIKMYDITEIDSITNQLMEKEIFSADQMTSAEGQSERIVDNTENCCTCCGITCRIPLTKSVTEMLFTNDYENNDAFQIIQIPPVRRLIEKKWNSCLKAVMLWGSLHFALMVILTVYAVEKADINVTDLQDVDNDFVWVFPWFAVLFGIVYLLVVVSVISSRARRQCFSNYWMKNLQHVLMLLTYAICIFIHSGTKDNYVGDVTLSIALIAGWSFFTFFLSPFRAFSFFTELIKQVILKDFGSFIVVIFIEYLAFSVSMYTMLRLHPEPGDTSGLEEHYNLSFGDMLLIMFKLLIGLEDVAMVANAKVYWYALTLYVVFVLLTYILFLNALIALMSNTSSLVQAQKYELWKVQQLSVVLFLEEIIMWIPIKRLINRITIGEDIDVTIIELETNSFIRRRRWFLQMLYLEDSKYDTDERVMLRKFGKYTYTEKSEENQKHSKRSVRCKSIGTQTVDINELKPDGTSVGRTLTLDIENIKK